MYPLKMQPSVKDYIWGGNRLAENFNKDFGSSVIAESWEVSNHPNGKSVIANGVLAGQTLYSVFGDDFPLLFKLIDARDKLSVQVHPNDEFANKYENGSLGKTELWYILDAEPESKLIYGVCDGVTKETFKAAIEQGDIESQLCFINVKKDDCFFIPAGLVHAIGEGLIIAEIQQNSDTTYRIYDYNRFGADGNPRELHIEKALQVINFENTQKNAKPVVGKHGDYIVTQYVSCKYFTFEKIEVENEYNSDVNQFEILFFSEGEGTVEANGVCERFRKGDTFVMPQEVGNYKIQGKSTVLKSYKNS